MKKVMACIVVGMVAAFAFGMASSVSAKPTELIVTSYGGAYQEFFETQIIPEFNKRYNADVTLAIGLARDWLSEMRAGGVDNPPYDVLMSNEIWATQLRREGYFTNIPKDKVPNLDNALIKMTDENGVVGVVGVIQPIGIAYRTDRVKNPPKAWRDLWNEEYRGELAVYTVKISPGVMFVLVTAKIFTGDEHNIKAAVEKIRELKPFKLSDFSGDMEKLLSIGEVSVGMLDVPAVARLKKQGIPVAWVAPEEGMCMFEQVFSVTKGGKKKDLAYKWVNYILSAEVQEKFVNRFYVTPATKSAEIPPELKDIIPIDKDRVSEILTWDWDYVNGHKQELIRMWNRRINR